MHPRATVSVPDVVQDRESTGNLAGVGSLTGTENRYRGSGPKPTPHTVSHSSMPQLPISRVGSLLLGIPLLALTATGCGQEPGAEVDGARFVPAVEEVYRVGALEGDRLDSFSRVTSVAFDDEGRLFILDSDTRQVTVVDPDGTPTTRFGSQGDGPGQFRSPQSLAVLASGDVAVADAGRGGVLIFSSDGEHLRTIPFGEGHVGGTGRLFPEPSDEAESSRDAVIFASRGIVMSRGPGGSPALPTDIPVRRLVLGGPEEGDMSVVLRAWRPTRDDLGDFQVRSEGGQVRISGTGPGVVAFEPQLHLALLPDGRLAMADSSTYRIGIYSREGELLQTVERPVTPRPVGEREREAERERRMQELAEGGGPQVQIVVGGPGGARTFDQTDMREMLEDQVRDMAFWPEIPVVRSLAADPAGRLWVGRSAPAGEAGSGDRSPPGADGPIDVLAADGSLLGTIPAGEFSIPHAFGPDGLVAWIEPDELEIPFVRVARLSSVP